MADGGGARLPRIPAATDHVRLLGARLLDGTMADPVDDAEVEVLEGTIVYAGRRRRRDIAGARTVDVAGGHLMPGFVDAHVHLVMSTEATEREQRAWFPEQAVVAALGNLRRTVEAGVTTARDLSGLTPGYRASVAAGDVVGPRLHLAIAMLSPTGGHADPVLANGTLPLYEERAHISGCAVVDTADEVIRTVRALVRTGADVIKVCTSGGVSSPHDDPADAGLPAEHVGLIVAEMRRRAGQPVAAHAQSDDGARAAVVAGAASVEHGYDLSPQTVALMVEHGTVLVPTLSTLLRTAPADDEDALRARRARQERAAASLASAIAAGVPIAMGTDAGLHPQGRNLVELGHLVRAGLSPLAAIHAGTLAGARLLRLDRHLGSVEPGKLADLVLTELDPLADPDALADPASVRAVLQAGRFVKDADRLAGRAGRGQPIAGSHDAQ